MFPKMKSATKSQDFPTIEEIKARSLNQLKAVPKPVFDICFMDWREHWHMCIISDGLYFGDKGINFGE